MKRLLPIIILILISSIVIFYKFNDIPKNLSYDEVEFTKLALSLDNKSYIPYSSYATGHSTLYFYILLFSFKLFGVSNFALRLPAAIFGIFNVVIFYLIMKLISDLMSKTLRESSIRQLADFGMTNYLPFLLSIIFITSRWYIDFSRFAFEATFLLFLELLSVYFFLRYWKNNKTRDILLTSLFAGLAYNSYTPGRIFFILIFGFLASKLLANYFKTFNKKRAEQVAEEGGLLTARNAVSTGGKETSDRIWKLNLKQFIFSLSIFVVIIAPLSLYLAFNKDIRFDQQFFLKNIEMGIIQKAQFLGENISKTALMFNFSGDINGRHNYPGKPALNPIFSIFLILGIYLSLKDWKKFPNNFFIIYFLLGLVPAILTYPWENPNMLRTFTVIPPMIYFVGKSLIFVGNGLKPFPKKINQIVPVIILSLILLSSLYELRTYFKYQSNVFKEAFDIKIPLNQIDFTKPIIYKDLVK